MVLVHGSPICSRITAVRPSPVSAWLGTVRIQHSTTSTSPAAVPPRPLPPPRRVVAAAPPPHSADRRIEGHQPPGPVPRRVGIDPQRPVPPRRHRGGHPHHLALVAGGEIDPAQGSGAVVAGEG